MHRRPATNSTKVCYTMFNRPTARLLTGAIAGLSLTLGVLHPAATPAQAGPAHFDIPNHRNFCADIEWRKDQWVNLGGENEPLRLCKHYDVPKVFAGGKWSYTLTNVHMTCPTHRSVVWWGFYPDSGWDHGFVRMHDAHVTDGRFSGMLETNHIAMPGSGGSVGVWVWLDCK